MKICPNCKTQCEDSKLFCHNCGSELVVNTQPTPEPEQTKKQETTEQTTNTPPKKKTSPLGVILAFSIILNIILVISTAYYLNESNVYYDKYWDYRRDYTEAEWIIKELESDLKFFDEYARVLPDDGSKIYHRYGCSKLNTKSFWIYNTDLAKLNGSPCRECCPND